MQIALALAAIAEGTESGPPPIIDLDSTVFVQWLLFLVTALVLSRLLFKPFLAVRAERERGIDGARDEARGLDEEARARLEDYEARLARARAAAEGERLALRGEALERERQLADAARGEAHASLEASRRVLDADTATARKDLDARAQDLARSIARKILNREVA